MSGLATPLVTTIVNEAPFHPQNRGSLLFLGTVLSSSDFGFVRLIHASGPSAIPVKATCEGNGLLHWTFETSKPLIFNSPLVQDSRLRRSENGAKIREDPCCLVEVSAWTGGSRPGGTRQTTPNGGNKPRNRADCWQFATPSKRNNHFDAITNLLPFTKRPPGPLSTARRLRAP
jgi:hypothetical protein